MGEVGEAKGRPGRRRLTGSRKRAMKDALPDVQPPGTLKEAEVEEVAAESDEEDD